MAEKISRVELNSALLRSKNFPKSDMAVMKTCCGCLTTQSGTMTILLLYSVAYIAGIVYYAVALDNGELGTYVSDQTTGEHDCKTGENKDTWWCDGVVEIRKVVEDILIAAIVILSIFLITAILALFGTSKGKHWFMMPWIILEFIALAAISVSLLIVVIIFIVYLPEHMDSSGPIACGVISAAFMAFLFYLWLCVVSHFQILREVSALGLTNMEHVQPFHNEFDDQSVEETHQEVDEYEEENEEDDDNKDDSDDDDESDDDSDDDDEDMNNVDKSDDDGSFEPEPPRKDSSAVLDDVEQLQS